MHRPLRRRRKRSRTPHTQPTCIAAPTPSHDSPPFRLTWASRACAGASPATYRFRHGDELHKQPISAREGGEKCQHSLAFQHASRARRRQWQGTLARGSEHRPLPGHSASSQAGKAGRGRVMSQTVSIATEERSGGSSALRLPLHFAPRVATRRVGGVSPLLPPSWEYANIFQMHANF